MRFTKGSKVEVFSTNEISIGSWLGAEIIRGNGHTYSVKYGWFPMADEGEEDLVVERVPRKVIRPFPPPAQGDCNWDVGDLVEVFDNLSWKAASIVKIIGHDNFLVTVLGLSKSLLVHRSHLRVRQCWQDGKWFEIGKGMEIVRRLPNTKIKQCIGEDYFCGENNFQIQNTQMVSTRTLKRKSSLDMNGLEAHPVASQKRRLIENSGCHPRIFSGLMSSTLEKVDSIVYPNVSLGENNVHSSFNVATAEFSRMDAGCGTDSFLVDSTISNDGCASSVGSCSTIGNDLFPLRFPPQHSDSIGDYCSDAESSSGVEYEKDESFSSSEQFGLEFHRSELHTYLSAIENLYVSGPLSWEDEAKLTDLRDLLHISDDEHLQVLRNLISANRMPIIS